MADPTPGEVYARVLDCFNRHDWAGLTDHFADEATLVFPGGPPLGGSWQGIERIREFYGHIKAYVESQMPDVTATVEAQCTGPDGEYGIIFRQVWTSNGRRQEILGMAVIKVRGDKLTYLKDFLPTY